MNLILDDGTNFVVEGVSVGELRDGDIVVLRTDALLSQYGRENITKAVGRLFDPAKVLILDGGMELEILRDMRTK